MKKTLSIILSVLIVVSCVGTCNVFAQTYNKLDKTITSQKEYSENSAIVLLKSPNKNILENKSYFGSDIKIKKTFTFGKSGTKSNVVAILTSDTYNTKKIIEIAKSKKYVTACEPNYKRKLTALTNDAYENYQWAIENNGQNGGVEDFDINPESIWNEGVTSSEKVIAIVDTGVDLTHEDLKDNLWTNENTRDLPGIHGYDFVNYDSNPQDDNGHGTHCAGIITATANNEKGITGVNQNAKIMALKVLDEEGYGWDETIMNAFYYIYEAQLMGVDIVAVNNSWGSSEDSDIYKTIFDAIGKNGALLVCASGNEGVNTDTNGSTPANTDSPYCISVGATNEKGELADFSNYGAETVDLAAPGTDILSTVSYNCYNPSIYSDEKQQEVSQYFNDFEDDEDLSGIFVNKYTSQGDVKIERVNTKYFGKDKNGSSLKVTVSNALANEKYIISIPYTAKGNLAKGDDVTTSFMFREEAPNTSNTAFDTSFILFADTKNDSSSIENALGDYGMYFYGEENYWTHLYITPASKQKDNEQRVLSFCVVMAQDSDEDYTFYIDDLGVSKPTADTSVYEKYDFYNGTSMATPYVTGAVALISALHKDLDAISLKALIMSSVRKTDELKDKTVSGGVLDLSKAISTDNIAPILSSKKAEDGKIIIEGKYFTDDMTVQINGEDAVTTLKTDEKVEIDAQKYVNTKVKVVLQNSKGSVGFTIKVKGKINEFVNSSISDGNGSQFVSDGKNLYLIDLESNTISKKEKIIKGSDMLNDFDFGDIDLSLLGDDYLKYIEEMSSTSYENFEGIAYASATDLYPEYSKKDSIISGYLAIEGNCAYLNGKLWFITNYESGGNHYKLVSYNLSSAKWKVESSLPDDSTAKKYSGSTLASFNGELYLLGGISTTYLENNMSNAVSSMVRKFNESTGKWSVLSDMPEARYGADARQVGNRLVVSFGSDGTVYSSEPDEYTVPKPLIFDGENWTVSQAETPKAYNYSSENILYTDEETDFYVYDWFDNKIYYKLMPVFSASGGITNDSIIYSGLEFEKYGEFLTYNPTTDTYGSMNYSMNKKDDYSSVIGASVGSKYYIYKPCEEVYEDDDVDWSLNKKAYSYDDDYYDDETGDNMLYSFNIKSGNFTIKNTSTKGGKLNGTGDYLPGQKATLTAVPDKTHTFGSLTVDGKKYTKKSVTVLVSKNITAKAVFKDIPLKSIKLNKKGTVKLKVKKTLNLKVYYNPTNVTVKEVTFKSSNKKVAKVNNKGKVTAKSKGKAVITCKHKSGKTAKVTIVVK